MQGKENSSMTGLNAVLGLIALASVGIVTLRIVKIGKEPLPEKYTTSYILKQAEAVKNPALDQLLPSGESKPPASESLQTELSIPEPAIAGREGAIRKLIISDKILITLADLESTHCFSDDICSATVIPKVRDLQQLHARVTGLLHGNAWLGDRVTYEQGEDTVEYLFIKDPTGR